MRVLIYGFTGTVLGGIETFVLNMNEHMSEDCVFNYIISGDICDFRERIEKRGGLIHYLPLIRRHPIVFFSSLWRVLGEEKMQGTNVFYQQIYSMAILPPAVLAKLRGYKVILHAHNNGLQNNKKVDLITHCIGKFFSRFFGFTYFTNSQLSTNFMFGKNVNAELIYNAIDVDKFAFDSCIRKSVRTEIGCGNKTVIGFVGRLAMQKNPLFMIKVFMAYHMINANSELWIAGDGNMKDEMNNLIETLEIASSVKMLGRRNDIHKLMQGMDILLQPSLFEGLGIVLVEAQATGLPVISSETVIPHEAVVSNIIKLLSLKESATFWAQECDNLLNKCKTLDRNKAIVPENYNIQLEAKRLEKLLMADN